MTETNVLTQPVWAIPDDIDVECISLCQALNMLPGIHTVESCCGHGKRPFLIWMKADSLGVLPPMLYYFDNCHCGYSNWTVKVNTDCAMSPVTFYVEAEGEFSDLCIQADYIAELIEEWAIMSLEDD